MGKIIIQNDSNLSDLKAIELVLEIINKGKISNYGKNYCYATTYIIDGKGYVVYADKNKKSDKFRVANDPLYN